MWCVRKNSQWMLHVYHWDYFQAHVWLYRSSHKANLSLITHKYHSRWDMTRRHRALRAWAHRNVSDSLRDLMLLGEFFSMIKCALSEIFIFFIYYFFFLVIKLYSLLFVTICFLIFMLGIINISETVTVFIIKIILN